MSATVAIQSKPKRSAEPLTEPAAVRRLLIGVAGLFLALFLFLPLAAIVRAGP